VGDSKVFEVLLYALIDDCREGVFDHTDFSKNLSLDGKNLSFLPDSCHYFQIAQNMASQH